MAQIAQDKPKTPAFDTRLLTKWGLPLLVAALLAVWLLPLIASQRPSRIVESLITGTLIGGVYALIALGIVIINKASGVFNFAHGYMMVLGGLIFHAFFGIGFISPVVAGLLASATVLMVLTMNGWQGLRNARSVGIGVVVAVGLTLIMSASGPELQLPRAIISMLVGATLIGLVAERFAIRPLIGQPLFAAVLMTLAISEVMKGFVQLVWGSIERPLPIFSGLREQGIPFPIRIDARETLGGTIIVRTEYVIAFGLALVAFAGFVLFFRYTTIGLAMRATAENQNLAQSVGLRVRLILAIAWGIAALLAAVAGVLQGGTVSLSLSLAPVALLAFPAVLLGGLESIAGALIGGLVIGLVQELAGLLFPGTEAGTELAPYLVLMIVLVLRPDGLFGQKRIDRI